MNIISFKFKNEKKYGRVFFSEDKISLLELKSLIAKKKNLGLLEKYELILFDDQNKECFT